MKSSHLLSLSALLLAAGSAHAVNVSFTVQATSTETVQSASLNAGAPFGVVNASQQSPGSLGARTLSGIVTVDVDNVFAPTTIQFISATLDPSNFGTNLSPAVGGSAGSAPAEFGLLFTTIAENVAWRNSITTLTSGIIAVGGGGAFAQTGISFALTAGTVDFGTTFSGTGNLNTVPAAASTGATAASYTVAGNVATLSLPSFDVNYITNFGGAPGTIRFTGSVTGVATVVPEPAVSGFAAGAAALLFLRRRRQ